MITSIKKTTNIQLNYGSSEQFRVNRTEMTKIQLFPPNHKTKHSKTTNKTVYQVRVPVQNTCHVIQVVAPHHTTLLLLASSNRDLPFPQFSSCFKELNLGFKDGSPSVIRLNYVLRSKC
jgi:hypothetical protein